MHADDGVEVVLAHREDHAVAQDAGVVDDDVEPAEGLDRLVDDALCAVEVGDVVVVGHGLAPTAADDLGDLLGGPLVGPLAGDRAAQVVDDDLRAFCGELERLTPADTVPGPGDDRHLAVENPVVGNAHRSSSSVIV